MNSDELLAENLRLREALRAMARRTVEYRGYTRELEEQCYHYQQGIDYAPFEEIAKHRKAVSDSFFSRVTKPTYRLSGS